MTGWGRVAVLTLAVAVVAAVAATSVHSSCTDALPFAPPEEGTDRAGYCSAIHGSDPWVLLVLVPAGLMLVGGVISQSRPRLGIAIAAVLMLAVVANAFVAGNLEYARPV